MSRQYLFSFVGWRFFVCAIIEELLLEEYYYLSDGAEILVMGLYLVPKMILALRDMNEEPDKILHTIVKYILPIFTLCAMGIRIKQYGMTPGRYLGVVLIVFEIGTLVIRHFWKEQYEKLMPFLCLLVVIAVFVLGINMNTAPDLWQLSYLKKYYQAVENGEMISELACERLTGAYHYLTDKPEMQEELHYAYHHIRKYTGTP